MLDQENVHFLHIGKTGGTALKSALLNSADLPPWLHLHTHATTLSDVPKGDRVFFFLRNPISRFISGFYSRQRQGKPRYSSPWSNDEARAFNAFKTANQLALALSSENGIERANAILAMNSIQHVRDSYWQWFGTPDKLLSRRNDILFIGQQEHLGSDVNVLSRHLRIPLLKMPTDEIEAHRNPVGIDVTLDANAVENLISWYEQDFYAVRLCIKISREAGFGGSLAFANTPPYPCEIAP